MLLNRLRMNGMIPPQHFPSLRFIILKLSPRWKTTALVTSPCYVRIIIG